MATWRFVLAPRNTLTAPIGILANAYDRQISVGLNEPGSVSFKLPLDDHLAGVIAPQTHAIIAYRDQTAVWSGPVVSVVESAPGHYCEVRAAGWFSTLEGRVMRMPTPSDPSVSMTNPSFSSSTTGWDVYTGTTMTRDTSVYDTSSGSGKFTPSSSIVSVLGGQARFTGTSPAPGHDYFLTFKWRYTSSFDLAGLAASLGVTPLVYFQFGSYSPDDATYYNIPWATATKDTWHTVTMGWTPRVAQSWTSSTSYSKYPGKGYGSANAAFRFYLYTNGASVFFPPDFALWLDSFTLSSKSLPVFQKTYTATQACTIASGIINDMNAVEASGITVGTTPSTATRTRTYKKYDNVGRAIQELSDIENGFDWTINPLTKVFDMHASYGSTKAGVHFGYRSGPDNLASVGRTIDGSSLANYVVATGKYGSGVVSDGTSISTYGLREDVVSIGDFASSDYSTTLLAVAGAELLFRKDPRQIFSVTPKPHVDDGSVPEPYVDYWLGDTVYLSANVGRLYIQGQAVRIFGISISIDENGTERVGDLRLIWR